MQGKEVLATGGEETPTLIISTRPATLQNNMLLLENPVRRVERAIQVRSVPIGRKRDLMPRAYCSSASRREAQPNNSLGGEI